MTSLDPLAYQMLVIASALDFYVKTGMKVNSAYTPSRMMATAARLTSTSFRPREYGEAAAKLRQCAAERAYLAANIKSLQDIQVTIKQHGV